jgi:hypothetical protein
MAGLEMKDVTRKVNEFMLFEVYLELLPLICVKDNGQQR